MDEMMAAKQLHIEPLPAPVYVCRAGMAVHFAAESYIEQCIAAAGGIVFRPETHSSTPL